MPDTASAKPPGENLSAAIINSSADAIYTQDLSGKILSWNAGAEGLFGYAAPEIVGQPVALLYPSGRRQEDVTVRDHYETVHRHKDGTVIDISLAVSPIRNESGRVVGAAKIARDIRMQKRIQEQFRVTLSSIDDGVVCTDEHGRVNFINTTAQGLAEWTDADAVGRPAAEILHFVEEATRAPLPPPAQEALRHGKTIKSSRHTALISRTGVLHPVEYNVSPIRTSEGRSVGAVVVLRDVAERRAADVASLRLAAIINGSDDAIVGKNLSGIVTDWNPGAQRLFGYTAQEMIGQSILKLLPADRLNEEQQILARLQRGERVEHFETIRVRKDGTTVDVSLTISPIRDRDGVIIGASKIARDVTALRVAQEKLKAHALELEVKVRERSRKLEETVAELEAFSYSLSHDMRAPLRAIQSFTEIVLLDFGDKIPDGLPYLQKVVSAAGRMDRLIQDVLAFTRISRTEIRLAPVDVEQLVRDIVLERPELQAPGANVSVKGRIPQVIGHDASLTQCLSNLLHNAVKFVPSGTKPTVEVYGETIGERVRLCVRDNGIGIDAEGQKRLFAIFQRLNGQNYHGTGIGLAIVRKAAERMKGTVGVESTPGQGSTFWVELPAASATAA